MTKEMPKRSCDAMVVGTHGYRILFDALTLVLQQNVAEKYGVDFKFRHTFFDSPARAWDSARTSPCDAYFIDGAYDKPVTSPSSLSNTIATLGLGKSLSDSIRELYPSSAIVGMSVFGEYLREDKMHNYDVVIDTLDLKTETLTEILVQLGFIPSPNFEEYKVQKAVEEAAKGVDHMIDDLMEDPVARKAMQEEGY